MTDAERSAVWTQADADGDGLLSDAQAECFTAMTRIAHKTTSADGVITQAIFEESCKADIFKAPAIDAVVPLEGANSFTETQAKDRVVASDMAIPWTMTKDNDGIWQGAGIQDGKSVDVAIDHKGNVVAK